ncbi:MAG: PEP-CTERM sorting domain-containing protein [Pseudomonadales bacterium]|nr:PEP-CTERM sorting domain-containing protein [Pseudomonadales bacterium]
MKLLSITSVFLGCAISGYSAAVTITPTTDGGLLAGTILGSGVTIDPGSISYTGSATQGATFTDGGAIGISSGIILTSGDATLAVGPNTSSGTTGSLGTPGDADLSGLIGGTPTFDANILEFEFTTDTGDLFFDFVFASEEYNEYLGFIDPFGLFVDGVNYALAPDGSPISVGTVNCGPTGTDPGGPNCSFFNNNDGGFFDIEYDGFTDVFTASILGLGAGTHTMKFAISDASDTALDSSVFIAGGSFSAVDPTNPVPLPSTTLLIGIGLLAVSMRKIERNKR